MKKIKVIHPITRLILGGAQQNTMETCSFLDGNRFDPEIISGPDTGSEGEIISEVKKRGVPLTIIPELVRELDLAKDFIALKKMISYFKAEKPHIVHTHSSKAGILGRWAARIARVPVIIHTVHGWGHHNYQNIFVRRLFVLLERATEKITDKLIVVSDLNAEKGLKDNIGTEDKYTTIHSSIKLDDFIEHKGDTIALKKQIGLNPEFPVVGTVGRLSPQKNPLDFVRVAAAVKKQIPNVQFLFVGDGPLRPETEAFIKELGVSEDIFLPGLRKDIPELLSCMDIFILTSLWEGLPRVIPQAMASRLPVVANGVDGVNEVIDEGENGFIIPPGNVSLMTEKVVKLLSDHSLRIDMGTKGQKKAVQEFSLQKMVDKIQCLYDEVLALKADAGLIPVSLPVFKKTAAASGVDGHDRVGPPIPVSHQQSFSGSQPLKILHIFKEYFPDKIGGVQETIRQISKYKLYLSLNNKI